jgi:hypothetical protein
MAIVSVLTVINATAPLEPLAGALALQRPYQHRKARPFDFQWVIVDLNWPHRLEDTKALHGRLLPNWRVTYGPAPQGVWGLEAPQKPYAMAGALRNGATMLAGNGNANVVWCAPLGVGQIPLSPTYLSDLVAGLLQDKLLVPKASWGAKLYDAAPFALADLIALNGYDELFDAGAVDAPARDLVERLTEWYEIKEGHELQVLEGASVKAPPQVKCDWILRSSGSFAGWDANGGVIPTGVRKALKQCPELRHEHCTYLGRPCAFLDLARFGHKDLEGFLASRPEYDFDKLWHSKAMRVLRERLTIAAPIDRELALR